MKKSLLLVSAFAIAGLIYFNLSRKIEAAPVTLSEQPVRKDVKYKPSVKKSRRAFNEAPRKDEAPLQVLKTAQDFKPRYEIKREAEKNEILKSRWISNLNANDAAIALTLQNRGTECRFNCERITVNSLSIAGIKINTDAPYYKNQITEGHFLAQTPAVYVE